MNTREISRQRRKVTRRGHLMTVRQLIAALLASCEDDFDREVFLAPNAQPVDAVEAFAGNKEWELDPYIILRGPA